MAGSLLCAGLDLEAVREVVAVVLAQRFDHFPLAVQAGMEGDQIACYDTYRFAASGGDQDFAFQNVGAFSGTEVDGEFRHFFFPDRPLGDAQFLQLFFARVMYHGNFAHE